MFTAKPGDQSKLLQASLLDYLGAVFNCLNLVSCSKVGNNLFKDLTNLNLAGATGLLTCNRVVLSP